MLLARPEIVHVELADNPFSWIESPVQTVAACAAVAVSIVATSVASAPVVIVYFRRRLLFTDDFVVSDNLEGDVRERCRCSGCSLHRHRASHFSSIFSVALTISSISWPDLLTTSPAWPPIMPPIAAEFMREITTLPALVW